MRWARNIRPRSARSSHGTGTRSPAARSPPARGFPAAAGRSGSGCRRIGPSIGPPGCGLRAGGTTSGGPRGRFPCAGPAVREPPPRGPPTARRRNPGPFPTDRRKGEGQGGLRVPEMEHSRGTRGPVAAQDDQGFFQFEGGYRHSFPIRPVKDRTRLPDPDQFAVERKEERVISRFPKLRVRTGAKERFLVLGVGDLALPTEGGELLLPPFPHRLDEPFVAMVHEVEERGDLSVLLPHEQERQEGR